MKNFKIESVLAFIIVCNIFSFKAKASDQNIHIWKAINKQGVECELPNTVYKGKKCFTLDGKNLSTAILKDHSFKNFKLELDIAGQYVIGVGFRASDLFNYEHLYFRPFRDDNGDDRALQYIPINNGLFNWKLYNAPLFEKKAPVKENEWMHTVFIVLGDSVEVYFDNAQEPCASFKLQRSSTEGNILLCNLFARGYFANITVNEIPNTKTKYQKQEAVIDPKFIRDWELSKPYTKDVKDTITNYINLAHTSQNWQTIKEEQNPFIDMGKYFEYPKGIVVAKHTISSEIDTIRHITFDFTGILHIYLNGTLIFKYQKGRFERMKQGTFKTGVAINKGDNELIFIIEGDAYFFGEGFNTVGRPLHQNWGFIAELE